jgi:hypothetical protein
VAKVHKFRVSSTRSNDLVCRSMAAAEAKGTMMQRAGRCQGRWVELDGRRLRNFGTCRLKARQGRKYKFRHGRPLWRCFVRRSKTA